MIQDNLGFLWFGTEDGLNKYDGYTFTVYEQVKDKLLVLILFLGTSILPLISILSPLLDAFDFRIWKSRMIID